MATIELPAGTLGVDYSFERPDPVALANAGVRFVCRYLAPATSKKIISAAERDALWQAGLSIVLNWEQGAGDFLDPSKGSSQGATAAKEAHALGYPISMPIIVSCDQGVPASAVPAAEAYFKNFRAATGDYPLGVYAEATIANALVSAGYVEFVWVPDATAWSRGVTYTRADVEQHPNPNKRWPTLSNFGASIDVNLTLRTISAWSGTTPDASPSEPHESDEPPAAEPGSPATYTVRPGDSWWRIADTMLGSGQRGQELATFNGRSLQSIIHPGDVLHLPPA